MKIHNYLDKLTIEEVAKYSAAGFELIINDGHVQGMTTSGEAAVGEADQNGGRE